MHRKICADVGGGQRTRNSLGQRYENKLLNFRKQADKRLGDEAETLNMEAERRLSVEVDKEDVHGVTETSGGEVNGMPPEFEIFKVKLNVNIFSNLDSNLL